MEKVASHINEMQKIYEDYGAVFDQLVAEQIGHDREVKTGGFDSAPCCRHVQARRTCPVF